MSKDNLYHIKFGRKYYYQHADLVAEFPYIFRGCKTTKDFIKKYDLNDANYTFARESKDNKWNETNGTSRKFDKMFISSKWFDNKFDDDDLTDPNIITDAPDIIELEDNEKFFDNDENIVEIEVRGEREFDKCYFKVKDIADGFGLESLRTTLLNKDSGGYVLNEHYVYFNVVCNSKKGKIKKLFLTYNGLMRVLFASRKESTKKFVKWASKIIFTHQLGKPDDKIKLAGRMLDISPKTIRSLLNKSSNLISSIYLFSIGQAKHLRDELDIPDTFDDDDMIYRFGTTSNLSNRISQHEKKFGNIDNNEFRLEIFEFVDPKYIFKAETRIAHLFEGMDMKVFPGTKKELVSIPKDKLKVIKEHYATISNSYIGSVSNIKSTYEELLHNKEKELAKSIHEQELAEMKHQKELAQKDKELMAEKYEKKLIAKDNEILQLKLKESERKRKRLLAKTK